MLVVLFRLQWITSSCLNCVRSVWILQRGAPREILIRRLSFDLLGLPPNFEAIEQFVNNESPDAYEQLVDRLLASPEYGERWGRHWLDVAGYADSEGYTDADTEREWAYAYRDYVIRAFNENMPYDQFVKGATYR